MATLLDLDRRGELFKYDPGLWANEQEWRMIFASPQLKNWIENDLPSLVSTWDVEVSPEQQFDALGEEFCSGSTLEFGTRFHPVQHVRDGIWELKTPDIRIFGWFHAKDCFVGWRAGHADYIKQHSLYYGMAGEAAHFRDQLDLDQPKFIPGEDPNAVVSNYSYP